MSSLSQASRLAYLPSAHDAFQGHAAHRIEWSICLGPRTQRVPVYPQVLPHSSRLLHGAAHAATTVARSSGMCDTHMTHFGCKEVSLKCADMCGSCAGGRGEDPLSVEFCAVCVSITSHLC